ncbi:hypothetical protein E2C01_090606 [Portunus trituberculatus]|uniref:Immunoglobulin I-set domain-containing protein n=1 Tax=Portunus trituberculatus TaxID=210409 RepID=A0A5B7JQJ9_PORTR|nr:hypothetical protein [Portunus trituberculatus]
MKSSNRKSEMQTQAGSSRVYATQPRLTLPYLTFQRTNGKEVVILERVGLDSAGVYKCEVMAETNFQTEFREANMTVICE